MNMSVRTSSGEASHRTPVWRQPGLWVALAAGLTLKLALITSGSISFDSDEAIMALIARHILRGELAIFYWGQAYMGVLDSYLIAGFFALFGQTILTARLAALTMFLLAVGTTYLLAYRLSGDAFGATAAALLLALPPVMLALYTSVSLGAFLEILVLDNLLFLIGWDILSGRRDGVGWWALAGFLGGVGWWELPIIAASIVPLAIIGLWRLRPPPWAKLATAGAAFLAGTSPWIYQLLTSPSNVVGDLIGVRLGASLGNDPWTTGLPGRLVSVLFFNLPALVGLRPSWTVDWVLWPVGVAVGAFYLWVLWQALRRIRFGVESGYRRVAIGSLLLAWAVIMIPFVLSPFGSDPTGRYLMLLYPPLVILAGDWLGRVRQGSGRLESKTRHWLAPAIVGLLLAYNLFGIIKYARLNPPGLSTQLAVETVLPHEYDDDLIAFLDGLGIDRGYAPFWVTYRFAFLTDERIILAPALPYKADLSYTYRDDRYPPYSRMVHTAERVAYVTANLPNLDEAIRAGLDELGLAYQERRIGPYTVFYDLARNVRPEELDIYGQVSGQEIYDLR